MESIDCGYSVNEGRKLRHVNHAWGVDNYVREANEVILSFLFYMRFTKLMFFLKTIQGSHSC